jgi:N-acetylmuramic acid 6-phosphate etherase
VIGALTEAKERGALAVAVVCRKDSPLERLADIAIVLDTGKEVLEGSSRLKAGTAQKIALNMLSTAVMAKRGLVYRDEMVAMRPTNEKLKTRAVRIVTEIANIDAEAAEDFLRRGNWHLPSALVAAKWGLDAPAASLHLSKKSFNVAAALTSPPGRDDR